LKKKTADVKYVIGKQRTFTIKAAEAVTPARSALSWLYAAPATKESTTTQRGQKKKAT
jgi:hypothetical protein